MSRLDVYVHEGVSYFRVLDVWNQVDDLLDYEHDPENGSQYDELRFRIEDFLAELEDEVVQ